VVLAEDRRATMSRALPGLFRSDRECFVVPTLFVKLEHRLKEFPIYATSVSSSSNSVRVASRRRDSTAVRSIAVTLQLESVTTFRDIKFLASDCRSHL
jgi:hypothetical protein